MNHQEKHSFLFHFWFVFVFTITIGSSFSACRPLKSEPSVPYQGETLSQESRIDTPTTDTQSATDSSSETPTNVIETPMGIDITISAAGDVSLGNHKDQGYAMSFRKTYDELTDKGYFFENVRDFFVEDDFTIVNLEGVLTLSETIREGRSFYIKGDPEYANLLTLGGIEAVSMANNHKNDYGTEGVTDTIAALSAEGIGYAYDAKLGTYEVNGLLIGYVSVNENSMGTAVEPYLEEGINTLREQGASIIIACCHWGTEHENYPEDYQTQLGRSCIDWGADLVLGHHPHVLQGIENYRGKWIVYSLANFCFGANRNPVDKDTLIFQQTFSFDDSNELSSSEARIIPCSISSVSERNDFRPTPATDEEATRILNRMREYSQGMNVRIEDDGTLRIPDEE
jgi:poly-gamma-glutamate synthesis protein (capsule biosynthesis protein)